MLSRRNWSHDTEPESGKDRRPHDPEEVEQERISREQRETTLPFASEGLEQVRDGHC
jgi:hypothetical protein